MFGFPTIRSLMAWMNTSIFSIKRRPSLRGMTATMLCVLSVGNLLEAESSPVICLYPTPAQSGESAKQNAINALPLEKLDAQGRMKVRSVLENLTLFHRLPVCVIDCDPDLYLFVVQHPDVVVNIWNALKISQLQLKETAPKQFRMQETSGTKANLEFLYQSHNTQLFYAEGIYQGALARSVKGRALFLLKTCYLRDTDNRYYISSRLDLFLSVEPGAVELVTKTLQPILGKIADNNFYQTVAFVGSLSRTTELNSLGMQRLASRLTGVSPEVRRSFSLLTDEIAQKPTAVVLRRMMADAEIARQKQKTTTR
jgi:hypothetical protein